MYVCIIPPARSEFVDASLLVPMQCNANRRLRLSGKKFFVSRLDRDCERRRLCIFLDPSFLLLLRHTYSQLCLPKAR